MESSSRISERVSRAPQGLPTWALSTWPGRFATGLALVAGIAGHAIPAAGQAPSTELVSLTVGQRTVEGRVLAADAETLVLLRREGSLHFIPRQRISSLQGLGRPFSPQDPDLMQSALREEFGRDYSVSRTRHFLVVHPAGSPQRWATPFEELYQRFTQYFASRGLTLEEPRFPLVAVVLNSRDEFDRFLTQHQTPDPMVLGYYAPRSNRIITCRQSLDQEASASGLSTLVHEAAHQTAFNSGIHSRFCACPLWISEGLATMFETRGVNNSAWHSQLADRIHPVRLAIFRRAAGDGSLPPLQDLIADDRLFRSNPDVAYSLAWGLTFYLVETRPREYFGYLRQTASRADFTDYPPADRLRDFAAAFGGDVADLDRRMRQYLAKLPTQ